MASVLYAEKAFLRLVARRQLQHIREAESRGEQYHDMHPAAPLQCGVRAKLIFEPAPGGYTLVAILRKHPGFLQEELDAIADELLDGPVRLRKSQGADLEYVRIDALHGEAP